MLKCFRGGGGWCGGVEAGLHRPLHWADPAVPGPETQCPPGQPPHLPADPQRHWGVRLPGDQHGGAGAGGGPQTEGGGGGQRPLRAGQGGGGAGGERQPALCWAGGAGPQSPLVQVSRPPHWGGRLWGQLPPPGPGQSGQWGRLHLLRQQRGGTASSRHHPPHCPL